MVNAAVWFGAGVFFTFAGGPAVFSDDMKTLLGPNNFPYFSGAIAQVLIARYFMLQLVCAGIAVAHLLAEWLYLGRPLQRFATWLLLFLLSLSLVGDLWMQPKIKRLHRAKYAVNATLLSRETAAHSLRAWHGVAQAVNLLMLAGLVTYLWRVTYVEDATQFLATTKLRNVGSGARASELLDQR